MRGHVIGIEIDERIARAHVIANLRTRGEALPLQVDRVESDVHQHFQALLRLQRDGMRRRVELDHAAGTRRS
jgi:hypothetical protein